jgi:thiol:disulfide interchange protein
VPAQPFRWDVPEIASGELTLTLRIPSGYAVYRDQIHIRGASDDVVLGEPAFPEPRLAVDPSDPEQWRALYETDIEIRVPLTGQGLLSLEVEHQGCRKGLCWPSTTSSHTVRVVAGAQESSPAKGGDE